MSAMLATDFERRIYPRIAVNGHMKYRLDGDSEFSPGEIINISQTGVLISMNRELCVDCRIVIIMESQQEDEPAIEILAEIVRIADNKNEYAYSYGCMILDVKDL